MKRPAAFLITIILLLFLTSCGTKLGQKPAASSVETTPATEKESGRDIVLDESGRAVVQEEPEKAAEEPGTINIPVAEETVEVTESSEEPEEEENSFEGYVLSESDVSENGVYLKSTAEAGKVTIDFAGDINFDDRYANMNTLRNRGGGIFSCIDSSLIERTNRADIFMINNEFPYSKRGTPLANKKFTFRAKPETVSMLIDQGADIVSLANNHAYDHGPDALLDTFDTLKEAGIPYVGAGHNIEEAEKPVYFIAGGMKLAFVSATQIERSLPPDTKEATETDPGVLRTLDPERFCNVIRTAKENSDLVIVYVHWGSENINKYEAAQTELARAYVDAGADLIIGDHPHVLQGIEYIEDVPVFYSLGNYWFSSKTLDNCLVEAVIEDKRISSLRFIPCIQKNCSTTELKKGSGEYERVLNEMREWSTENVEIDEDGMVTKK